MKKITSLRELAIKLDKGGKVKFNKIGKNLLSRVKQWESNGDIKIDGDFLIGTYN